MRSITLLLVIAWLCLHAGGACAKDKTTPDDLRNKHAGVVHFTSDRAVSDLYPMIHDATVRCWSDVAYFPSQVGGAAGELTRASRPISGELNPDGTQAHVIVQVRAAFGLRYADFLQVDLDRESDRTKVAVYYRNDVKAQRDYAVEVQHWLDGDNSWCAPSPSKRKPKPTPTP